MEYTGLFYSEDIQFRETSGFYPAIFDTGDVYYEVLRISDGTALFLEDHLQRLQNSLNLASRAFIISIPVIHYLLRNLIRRNNTANGNVKILIHFVEDETPVIFTFFVPHFYPGPLMYEKGVPLALYNAERRDPKIKKFHAEMIAGLNAFIKSRDIYDVLLADVNGNITEGSRTNIFFIEKDALLTPPADSVLNGITRLKVLEICKRLDINVNEQPISSHSLGKYESAFLTGTSPKILPVNTIDGHHYNVDNMLTRKLMKEYDNLIADYLGNN
jgi:branched-chain amino acid aminotransferase